MNTKTLSSFSPLEQDLIEDLAEQTHWRIRPVGQPRWAVGCLNLLLQAAKKEYPFAQTHLTQIQNRCLILENELSFQEEKTSKNHVKTTTSQHALEWTDLIQQKQKKKQQRLNKIASIEKNKMQTFLKAHFPFSESQFVHIKVGQGSKALKDYTSLRFQKPSSF